MSLLYMKFTHGLSNPHQPGHLNTVLLICEFFVLVRSRVTENRVIKIRSDQKISGPSFILITSHWSQESRNSQHAYAKLSVPQTAFTYSSISLQPIRLTAMRVIVGMTVRVINSYRQKTHCISSTKNHVVPTLAGSRPCANSALRHGRPTFSGKGPQPLLQTTSGAATAKITSGVIRRINYCVIFTVHT